MHILARPNLNPGRGRGIAEMIGRSSKESEAERTAKTASKQRRLILADNSVHLRLAVAANYNNRPIWKTNRGVSVFIKLSVVHTKLVFTV